MLSRKGSGAAVMASPAAGLERGRVRERLQAALAGLQELRLLRDRHGGMVSWALQLDREEPVTALRTDPVEAEEQRLEATLAALKQQLSRLRKQDVGLKTHLQQLDQQISELKLDVSKTSSDQLESDSRPSSGFYELSDGGTCSRSNSCTSVYSECLSSSQTSLIPLSPTSCHISPPPQVDVCCRRSADESPGQHNPPRATGLHLGSSRIRASAAGADQTRQRPVSTGDLERIMAQGLGCFRSTDAKKPQVCPKQKSSPLDAKFQRNQESCGGAEVYQYPSPLHAVALQSPIFFHGGEDGALVLLEGQGVNGYDSLEMGYKNKTLGYIDKLLQQRTLSKSQINAGAETVETQDSYHVNLAENGNEPFEVSPRYESILSPPQTKTKTSPVNSDQKRHFMIYSSQEPSGRRSQESPRAPEMQYRYSYQAATKEYSSDEVAYSTLKKNDGPQTENPSLQRNHSDKNCGDEPEMRKGHWQRPVVAHVLSTEESPSFEVQSSHTGSPEFVHAKFVPASSQRVKVRQADRKTKAVKIKRKGSDKPRVLRQQHSFSSGERTKDVGVGAKGEQKRSGKGKVSERGSTWQTQEHRQRSGSDSSLYSPGLKITHKVHPKPHPVPASTKLSKNRRPQCVEYEHPVEQRKRRQAAPKWLTDANIYQLPFVQHQRSKEHHARAMESIQMVRNISSKPGHWMGPSHPFHFPMSSSSFLQSLNTRYPPAPFQMSSYYPPRCESEYSAECASLFHSTIAESSEGEMSDNTTNRFGDSESSQSSNSFSDSDSSLSLDEGDQVEIQEEEGGLVWAKAALGPTAAGQPLRQLPPRPEPSACRIKASRALKKKIRRFQPASLKVMTLV